VRGASFKNETVEQNWFREAGREPPLRRKAFCPVIPCMLAAQCGGSAFSGIDGRCALPVNAGMSHLAAWINTAGLLLTSIGGALLFYFGMPARLQANVLHSRPAAHHLKTDLKYDRIGRSGFALIVVGSLLQLIAIWLYSVLNQGFPS
jgi:hypothetical protein